MVDGNFFSHISPGGSTPLSRIVATGYLAPSLGASGYGENLGWGDGGLETPAGIVQGWLGSPTHFANMVTPSFRDTGIGIIPETPLLLSGNGSGSTYVEEFGYHGV